MLLTIITLLAFLKSKKRLLLKSKTLLLKTKIQILLILNTYLVLSLHIIKLKSITNYNYSISITQKKNAKLNSRTLHYKEIHNINDITNLNYSISIVNPKKENY